MKIVSIPCLQDNYAYLIICEDTGEAAVVDPSEHQPVLDEIERQNVTLTTILNTHHHWDHVGGNPGLMERYPDLTIVGHGSDKGRIPGHNVFLKEGDQVQVGNLSGSFTHNPGHTTGGVTYYIEDAAFTGDTLFAAGCGRLFEGTPAQMYDSLCNQIGGHAPETKLYFGHEYTESNLLFALHVEPGNEKAKAKLERVREQRARGEFTTPTTLAEEWETNPFMRHDSPEIQASVKKHHPENDLEPASVLAVVRHMKDHF